MSSRVWNTRPLYARETCGSPRGRNLTYGVMAPAQEAKPLSPIDKMHADAEHLGVIGAFNILIEALSAAKTIEGATLAAMLQAQIEKWRAKDDPTPCAKPRRADPFASPAGLRRNSHAARASDR
jgi:hypothetical protein